jgi:hypothetical protein
MTSTTFAVEQVRPENGNGQRGGRLHALALPRGALKYPRRYMDEANPSAADLAHVAAFRAERQLFALGSEPIKLSCEQCQRLLGGLRQGGLLLTGLATERKSFVAALFEDRGDLIDKALPGHLPRLHIYRDGFSLRAV